MLCMNAPSVPLSLDVLIPVKPLARAKTRLAPDLSAGERAALCLAMLHDVLSAVAAARGLATIHVRVITSDPAVRDLAAAFGAEAVGDAGDGDLNQALTQAASALKRGRSSHLFVVHADLPWLTAADLSAMLCGHPAAPGLTLARAVRDGGTNALLCSPPDVVPFRFGRQSCERYLDVARRAGCGVRLIDRPGLSFDLDTPDDLRRAWAQARGRFGHTKTARLLESWGVGDAK